MPEASGLGSVYKTALEALTGANRLNASAVQGLPAAGFTTAAELVAALQTLTGTDRLDASAIQNLPAGGGSVDAETVRDIVGALLVQGPGITIAVDDTGDTVTVSAQVTTSTLAAYLQTANLVAAIRTAAGNPAANSVLTMSAAGALGARTEIVWGDPTPFDVQSGAALGLTGPALAKLWEFQTLTPSSGVITIPTPANTNSTTRDVGTRFTASVTANVSFGLADRDAACASYGTDGLLLIKNTSGATIAAQMVGGSGGRLPFKAAPGALTTVNVPAGGRLYVHYLYTPAAFGDAAEVIFNTVIY